MRAVAGLVRIVALQLVEAEEIGDARPAWPVGLNLDQLVGAALAPAAASRYASSRVHGVGVARSPCRCSASCALLGLIGGRQGGIEVAAPVADG